jgi:hypothetical protein
VHPPDGERIATLEQVVRDVRDDLSERRAEEGRTRERLHALEKVTAGLVELQRELHRANERKLQRMNLSIQWAGVAIGLGMFALALATIFIHTK